MQKMNVIIEKDNNVVKVISIIKKNTQMSIGEIKERLDTGKFVLSCNYVNTEELKKLKLIVDKLKDMGTSVKLFHDDISVVDEYLDNLIETNEGIEKDMEALDDIMLEEENESDDIL